MKQILPVIATVLILLFTPIKARPGFLDSATASLRNLAPAQSWTLVADDVTATVYNAVPAQCNNDPVHTASMFTLNLDDIASNHVIAMERTMMARYGIRYGDVVRIEGTDTHDGVWRVEDTMNRRFAGKNKIDILVPDDIKHGKWDGVRVYTPADNRTKENAKRSLL